MNFSSDNALGASPRVMQALLAANEGAAAAYGSDPHSQRAAQMLCEIFERDCAVFLVATGTAANALALAALAPPWGAVFCHADAHVNRDECGAPEFFGDGLKLVPIKGAGGKLTPAALEARLSRFPRGVVHHVQAHALSLSQATEAGTIYSCEEIAALSGIARSAGMGVHMDGARFANALLTLGRTPAEMTWKAGVDVLCFGATKNGTLACEAVVFFDPAKAENFGFRRKRSGHTISKGRFLGAQMAGYLEDGHWLDLARHANACAAQLSQGLAMLPGVRLPWPCQANEVFALLPGRMDAALRAAGAAYYDWRAEDVAPGAGEVFIRLVTSFATRQEDLARFVAVAAAA